MNDTSQLILDIWETVRDYLTAPKRTEVAHGIMTACLEHGFETVDVAPVVDEDPDLAEAFYDVYHDGEHPDDDDDDYGELE